ncbi:hypothetical protein DBR12_21015 [Acidovorax sp. HMWF029]|nr:hypothetical protein DBR12_21015 [Acidovorax sp. HMWF029]
MPALGRELAHLVVGAGRCRRHQPAHAAAQQCGYSDTGSFRKIFHRVSGTTPGAYRQRFRLRTTRKQWLGTKSKRR